MEEKQVAWSSNIEGVLKGIGDSCHGYKWMNIFAAKREALKYNVLMYTIIVSGAICGILSSVTSENYAYVAQIVVAVSSFIMSLASTIVKFSKIEQKAVSHKNIAAKFASLEGNVTRQLSLDRTERVPAGAYLEYVSKSFEDLFAATPLLPDSIYQKWAVLAKDRGMVVPKELGNVVVEQVTTPRGTEQPKTIRARPTTYEPTVESKAFSDGKMQYELSRLFASK